ncbi:hypothetical protein CR513_15168, partial [Mucuna pruriens]
MPTSIYKSLNFGDLKPIGMTIQLENRSVVQPLGVLKDVLVQDEASRKGFTLILGRPFLMTAKTKIDVHVVTLSMEFGDTLVQFNMFKAMKHLTKDHSLFGIDLIDELVEECLQLDSNNESISNFVEDTNSIGCLGSLTEEDDYDEVWEVHNLSDSEDDNIDLADLSHKAEWIKLLDQVCKYENSECVNKVGQLDFQESKENSSSFPSPMELKPLPSHLKYAYLDVEQQFPIIIASNIHREQEDKLLSVLRQHIRLRKVRSIVVSNSDSSNSAFNSDNSISVTNDFDFSEYSSSEINPDSNFVVSNFQEPEQMENNDRILKKLATLDVLYQPWCIQYPQLEPAQSYELKSGLIHLLPKFHGLAGEDPHKHLKEFHVVCSTIRTQGISEDNIKMKVFPFSLDGAAKEWLYLQPRPSEKKFVGSGNILERLYTNTRKDLTNGCGMCGSVGHPPNNCPILQEPPPPFRPQLVEESSLEDLMKQLDMNNIQFQKNIRQNNMQFQQNIIATIQELTTQIGQLTTMINQLQFEDFGQVPSQAILSPQENISDITMRSDMELPQQQSLKV